MLILLDTAKIDLIEKANEILPLDGVTTNPSLIVKEKTAFITLLQEIRRIIGTEKMLHVQVISKKAEEIVEEAMYLNKVIGGNLYIKVPVIPQGIKAMKIIKEKGLKITATAIFTPQQAVLAAKAGADFVAPYVNRLDNISANGINVVAEIAKIYNMFSIKTKILAASFKNIQQVHDACLAGAHGVTVPYDLANLLVHHPLTEESVEKFISDWEDFYGKGKLTKDMK